MFEEISSTQEAIEREGRLANIDQFTEANNGKAFYSSLEGLGEFIFLDYNQKKRKKR